MNRHCPHCSETGFEPLFSAPDFDTGTKTFQICRCRKCGLVRTEPQLSREELSEYYSLPYYGSGEAKFSGPAEKITRLFNRLRARKILSGLAQDRKAACRAPGKVLDIGCGRGGLLAVLRDRGYECHGVERYEFPSEGSAEGIMLHVGELKDIAFDNDLFDAVIIWHVLEHVEDPAEMFREARRILRPGGLLAVAVPNFGSIQSGLFRGDWFHLDLPRHIYHFTPGMVKAMLDKSGFAITSSTTFSAEQNIFGFIQSALNKIEPRKAPNRFYSLLKKTVRTTSPASLVSWAIAASCILPLAIFEYVFSGMAGKGASLIMYAKKQNM